MRLFKYKCPTPRYTDGMVGCVYKWTGKSNELCLGCGKTFDETRTIWYAAKRLYWKVLPYNWRPGQSWYRFKCWAWKRYTTVKPRKLGHTWCDRSHLLPHTMFEILCDFVEKELRHGHVDWDATPEHAAARDEMEALYKWWTEEYQDEYPFCLPSVEYNAIENIHEVEIAYEQMLLANCKRLIEVSPYMWT